MFSYLDGKMGNFGKIGKYFFDLPGKLGYTSCVGQQGQGSMGALHYTSKEFVMFQIATVCLFLALPQQAVPDDADVIAHLASVIAADGNLEGCCPGDTFPVDAFKSGEDEKDLFIFTGEGDEERFQVLSQNEDCAFKSVFDAYLSSMSGLGGLQDDENPTSEVTCVRIDSNTILCAWSEPRRIIILCRRSGVWTVCFDSKKINNEEA